MAENLLEVKNLKKYFPARGDFLGKAVTVKAVDGVNFAIRKGETLGLAGESGCGKTTIGKLILRLLEPTEGEIIFEGKNILQFNKNKLKNLRRHVQIIFQDPFASLDPRKTVEYTVAEPMKVHSLNPRQRRQKVVQLLDKVGITPEQARRYPHQFSGGQRQRIGIARALALNPKFIVADEPVSALDVSIQAQILNLMMDLQEEFHLTYLFIAHDLNVINHVSNQVTIMYLGKIVEFAPKKILFHSPLHPYTEALLSAIPIPDPTIKRERTVLEGDVPSPINVPSGCRFHTRCPSLLPVCKSKEPVLREIEENHFVACHLYGENGDSD